MTYEKKVPKPRVSNLILENREKLVVKGVDLHINKLNIDSSELGIEGEIISCEYSDRETKSKGGGFFARMFK